MADNTVYVVTGGNRGIGLALVKSLLARPSVTVVTTVRSAASSEGLLAEEITLGENSKLHVAILDFSTAIPPAKVLEAINASTTNEATPLDHINVLINNAANCQPMSMALQTPAEDLRAAFETNAIAPLMVFQGLWPLLQKAKAAPKLFMITSTVGSIGGLEAIPGGSYGPSKAALNWLTKALHEQNVESGLIAVALHPGWVATGLGKFSAKEWGYHGELPTTLESSVSGMLKVIDGASRETIGGKFMRFDGAESPW